MKKISFDFDDTLSRIQVQNYAFELLHRGFDVWVVTSRFQEQFYEKNFFFKNNEKIIINSDLYEVTDKIGILRDRIQFMNFDEKWCFFKDKDFIWHLDDDFIENNLIIKNTKTKAINSLCTNWKQKCERVLNK